MLTDGISKVKDKNRTSNKILTKRKKIKQMISQAMLHTALLGDLLSWYAASVNI